MKTKHLHNGWQVSYPRLTLSAILEQFCFHPNAPYQLVVKQNHMELVQSENFTIGNGEQKFGGISKVESKRRQVNLFRLAIEEMERCERENADRNMGFENYGESIRKRSNSKLYQPSKEKYRTYGNISPLRNRNNNICNDKKFSNKIVHPFGKECGFVNEVKVVKNGYGLVQNLIEENNEIDLGKQEEKGNWLKIVHKKYKIEQEKVGESIKQINKDLYEEQQFDSFADLNKETKSHFVDHFGMDESFRNIKNTNEEAIIAKNVPCSHYPQIHINLEEKEEKEIDDEQNLIKRQSENIVNGKEGNDLEEDKEIRIDLLLIEKDKKVNNSDMNSDTVFDVKLEENMEINGEHQNINIITNLNNSQIAKKLLNEDLDQMLNLKNPELETKDGREQIKQGDKTSKLTDEQVCQLISSRKKMLIDKKEASKILTPDENFILDMSDLDMNALLKLDGNQIDEKIKSVFSDPNGGEFSKSKITSKVITMETQKSGTKTIIEEVKEIREEGIGNTFEPSNCEFLNESFVPHYLKDKLNPLQNGSFNNSNSFVPSNIYTTKPVLSQIFEIEQ